MAVIQTGKVRSALESRFPELQFEVEIIKTRGNKNRNKQCTKKMRQEAVYLSTVLS